MTALEEIDEAIREAQRARDEARDAIEATCAVARENRLKEQRAQLMRGTDE